MTDTTLPSGFYPDPPAPAKILDFVPLTRDERERWADKPRQDGEHIGRLVEPRGHGFVDRWHVYRHRDGVLVCWEALTDAQADGGAVPIRIVTNTTDVNRLHRFLPDKITPAMRLPAR